MCHIYKYARSSAFIALKTVNDKTINYGKSIWEKYAAGEKKVLIWIDEVKQTRCCVQFATIHYCGGRGRGEGGRGRREERERERGI